MKKKIFLILILLVHSSNGFSLGKEYDDYREHYDEFIDVAGSCAGFNDVELTSALCPHLIKAKANEWVEKAKIKRQFKPNEEINRAEFFKVVVKAAGMDIPIINDEISRPVPFIDMKKEDWFFPFVVAGYQSNLIKGYEVEEGIGATLGYKKFKAGESVRLAEALKWVENAFEKKLKRNLTLDSSDKDYTVSPPSSRWYKSYFEEAYSFDFNYPDYYHLLKLNSEPSVVNKFVSLSESGELEYLEAIKLAQDELQGIKITRSQAVQIISRAYDYYSNFDVASCDVHVPNSYFSGSQPVTCDDRKKLYAVWKYARPELSVHYKIQRNTIQQSEKWHDIVNLAVSVFDLGSTFKSLSSFNPNSLSDILPELSIKATEAILEVVKTYTSLYLDENIIHKGLAVQAHLTEDGKGITFSLLNCNDALECKFLNLILNGFSDAISSIVKSGGDFTNLKLDTFNALTVIDIANDIIWAIPIYLSVDKLDSIYIAGEYAEMYYKHLGKDDDWPLAFPDDSRDTRNVTYRNRFKSAENLRERIKVFAISRGFYEEDGFFRDTIDLEYAETLVGVALNKVLHNYNKGF